MTAAAVLKVRLYPEVFTVKLPQFLSVLLHLFYVLTVFYKKNFLSFLKPCFTGVLSG